MNILNLFAGMEVGRLACERAGVPIDKYYSSEIDKYAIQVSKANWPDIIHLGDVTKVYGCTLPDIHLLLGGSPCQGFSLAGKRLEFDDPRSSLFFEYLRVLEELKEYNPNIYFLLENVAGCGIFTEKFICKCCGKEINRNTVSDMLKAVYAESWKNKNMQRPLPGTEKKGSVEEIQSTSKGGEETPEQSKSVLEKQGKISSTEKGVLPKEPGNYKSENGETPYDRQTQNYERWLYGFREDESQNEEVSREIKYSDEARPGFRAERKDTKEYPETEISRTEERGHSATFGETENGRQQMSNLRNDEQSSDRSHNPNNEGRQERNIKSSESLQKVQHSKRQSVDVVCDKCGKESGYTFTATDFISALLGVKPHLINSALVSAQNRKRLYWTNIPFLGHPKDKGIVLKDILETNAYPDEEKSLTLTSTYRFNPSDKEYLIDRRKQKIPLSEKEIAYMDRKVNDGRTHWDFGFHSDSDSDKSPTLTANVSKGVPYNVLIDRTKPRKVGEADIKGFESRKRVYSQQGKSPTLIGNRGAHTAPKAQLETGIPLYRKLTVTECKRLQTVPDEYKMPVSNTQAYKMLGNGWNSETIEHLLLPLGNYSCLF